ncbi:hypothetical protein EZV62_017176 [Acer yangbiense]|uniref:Disease resistance protein At4g27190-like leucine-rich repeats domain-containing protein n=1 Tax=Acer yangbiense TaxID=1000413 RepID=A0A5C7HFG0_9ROSI|nr:hypothetical protein EZV62_017176 [Acer yangbiense]
MVYNLSDISSSIYLAEGFMKGERKLQMVEYRKSKPFFMIEDSEALIYEHFDSFIIKEEEEELQQQEFPCRVQYLGLEDCECTVKLQEVLQSLSFLRGLSITESHKITSFQEASFPSQLRFIVIRNCDALQSLPMAWMYSSNTSLKILSIGYCDSLTCIARVQLPPNLKRLEIEHCPNLLTVLDEEEFSGSCNNTSCLEHLKIEDCPSLTSLWSKSGELPYTLRKITLSRCSNLATLASSGNLPKSLRNLSITECSKLKLIAKNFHDNTKLEKLYIEDCEKLETLPIGINNLISLEKLAICNCPAMVSIPEGDFPTSLTSFEIVDTNIFKSLFEWGLNRLTSLELLGIGRCLDVMSFPQEETGMILPTSLTALGIFDFPNLERLSSIAQNLTCLEKLILSDCPKLKYFPDDGLPKSLKQLEIKGCPMLEERCQEDEGLRLPIVSHSFEVSGYASTEEDD